MGVCVCVCVFVLGRGGGWNCFASPWKNKTKKKYQNGDAMSRFKIAHTWILSHIRSVSTVSCQDRCVLETSTWTKLTWLSLLSTCVTLLNGTTSHNAPSQMHIFRFSAKTSSQIFLLKYNKTHLASPNIAELLNPPAISNFHLPPELMQFWPWQHGVSTWVKHQNIHVLWLLCLTVLQQSTAPR